jgi:nucleoside-diphosphate-sugar epimerase
MSTEPAARTIAIAGARGFVGSHLAARLKAKHSVIGLARSVPQDSPDGMAWRACDLFSSKSSQTALQGVSVAFYLVHSMMPSSRLFQGSFHDTDLLLADNFAKACASAGVEHIIYLGGLVPPAGFVSRHLESRLEVEGVLASTGVPVTCLRAGMVVGPGGSSFEILKALVDRLPWMILPQWTQNKGQAIFIDDVVDVLEACLEDPALRGRTLDVVNGELVTYEDLLRQTASALGKRRFMFPVKISSTGFSKRWVQLFSEASHELISPLIDSLQCDLPQGNPVPEIDKRIRYRTFASMLQETLRRRGPSVSLGPSKRPQEKHATVRSIQRLPSLVQQDADFLAREYMRWLPQFFRAFIRVEQVPDSHTVRFLVAVLPWPLLVLERIDPGADRSRVKFHIVGGILSKTTTTGWLEFRQVAQRRYTLSAIHGFVPTLPWPVYLATQAQLHALVMFAFGRHLGKLASKPDR